MRGRVISNFEFRISNFPSPICVLLPEPPVSVVLSRRASSHGPRDLSNTGNPTVLATRSASSTVDQPQSASNEILTSSPRKVTAGPARRGFPRVGGRGVGAGKKEVESAPLSNVARRRAAGARGRSPAGPRNARVPRTGGERPWPRAKTADGGRALRRHRRLGSNPSLWRGLDRRGRSR